MIDPSIPLSIKAPQVPSMVDSMAKVAQIRAQQQSQQANQLQLQKAQREAADVQALDTAFASGTDRETILNQIPGHLRATVEKQFAEIDEADTRRKKAKADLDAAERDALGAIAYSVRAHGYDPQAVQIALLEAKAKGHDVNGVEQLLQQNPAAIRQVVDGLIAQSETYSQRAREDAAQQETVRANKAREDAAVKAAEAAAADRAADNARQTETAAETARHNRALESKQATTKFQRTDVLNDEGMPVQGNYDSATGKTYGPDGAEIKHPKPIPSALERQDQQKFQKAGPILESISELSERINTLQGVAAKARGEVERQKAKINLNDDVAEYEAIISMFTPMVARALGHTGVLTEQDVQSVKSGFPRPGDSKSLRDRKIKRILSIIGGLQEEMPTAPRGRSVAPGATPSGGGPLPSYQEYLQSQGGSR
jgi:hypothetical protein